MLNEDTGALFCLDLYGFSWREVSPNIHRRNGPKKKTGCGMFIHEDKVYLFGGDCNGQFTNELHVFNLSKGMYKAECMICGIKQKKIEMMFRGAGLVQVRVWEVG